MPEISLTLSDAAREFIERRIAQADVADLNDYFGQLIDRDQRRATRETIDRKLHDALDSGDAVEVTDE